MRLNAQQVNVNFDRKTAELAQPEGGVQDSPQGKADRARGLLRQMATDLVATNGEVKSGYLRLSRDGEGLNLKAGFMGSGATAATDLVKNLVKDAYGEVAASRLEDYLSRSKGGKVGTQSFVKLVKSLEGGDAGQALQDSRIKANAKLNTLDRQGADVGQTYRFDRDLVQGLQNQMVKLADKTKAINDQMGDPSQDLSLSLQPARTLAAELENAIKLLQMRPGAAGLPGAASLQQGLLTLLADVQLNLAMALIERNQLDVDPEQRAEEVRQDELQEIKKLLEAAKSNARQVDSPQTQQIRAHAEEALKTHFEDAPVNVQNVSDENQDEEYLAWKSMIKEYQHEGKTHLEPPAMPGGHAGYQSVSDHLAPRQDESQLRPSMAASQIQVPAQAEKEVVSPAQQGAWFQQDLLSRFRGQGCESADDAIRLLAPRAEAIMDWSYDDNEAALEFLAQGADLVQADLAQRLDQAPRIQLDESALAQGLKYIDDLVEQLYAQKSASAQDYLTVSLLLNMQRN